MADSKVSKIDDLISHLTSPKNPKLMWFRGHADQSWELVPTLYRLNPTPNETGVMKRFKQSAHFLLEKTPTTEFDWLFWMQHYGVPTRLLDWTESPLAALYFCVSNKAHENCDGAIWVLDPKSLNKAHNNIDDDDFVPSFDEDILDNYKPSTIAAESRTKLFAMAAIATRNNPRIQAQLGVFTIAHRIKEPMEQSAGKGCLVKLIIPKDAKETLREELNALRFDRFSLFPELSSIGHNINTELA